MNHTRAITLADLVGNALTRNPDRVAIVADDIQWTGRHLAETTFKIARALDRHGLKKGDGVACLLKNCPEFVAFHFACGLLGLRQTFLNPLNRPHANGFMIRDAEVRAIVTDGDLVDDADAALREAGVEAQILLLRGSGGLNLMALAEQERGDAFSVDLDVSDPFSILYTSGSTGQPKGVLQTQRVIVQMVLTTLANWEWPRDIRSLVPIPLTHAGGSMILPTLLRGGTLHIQRVFDPAAVLDSISRNGITAMMGVPTMIYALVDSPVAPGLDLSSLEGFFYGASPIASARLEEAIGRFGPIFSQFYGQTEAPMNVTYLSRRDHDLSRPERLASCGQVQAGALACLLDDDGDEVAIGDEGEVCVRGPLVMERYWNNPDATAEALKHGWLHTGDIARRDDDGYFFIVDRKKDMIISGGFNVYPREIEQVLAAHPAVAQVAVIGVPHERWGEAVHGIVVLREGQQLGSDELIAFVREKAGAVQAPKTIDFAANLPLTPVGKVDKVALKKRFWTGLERRVN